MTRRKLSGLSRGTTPYARDSSSLDSELLEQQKSQSKVEARMANFEYIERQCDPTRSHSAFGYQSRIIYDTNQVERPESGRTQLSTRPRAPQCYFFPCCVNFFSDRGHAGAELKPALVDEAAGPVRSTGASVTRMVWLGRCCKNGRWPKVHHRLIPRMDSQRSLFEAQRATLYGR